MTLEKKIDISVIVITYNQEKYIRKTLDSILNQNGDFTMEILVGDDHSSDSTPDILRDYENKYPDIFKIFCREKNLGPNRNFYELCIKSKGKYIASCEGDDYYCDVNKLKKQLDFLESNPQYFSCATNFSYVDENGEPINSIEISTYDKKYWYHGNSVYTLKDFNEGRAPSQGATIVHRNYYLTEDTSIIYKAHPFLGDITGWMLLIAHSDIYRMEDITVCYRRNMQETGHSWNARLADNPFHHYDMLKYFISLKEYAKNKLHINIDRKKDVTRCFFYIAEASVRYPTRARWACIWKMFKLVDNKLFYLGVILKAMYFSILSPSVFQMKTLDENDALYNKLNKTWDDFKRDASGKKLVLYGAGGGCRDLLDAYYDRLHVWTIIDTSKRKHDTYIYGNLIKPVELLEEINPEDTVILITTGLYYKEIAQKLEGLGFYNYYVYQVMESKKVWYKPLDWNKEFIEYVKG